MADLSTKYLGLNLKNPLIVGSSDLTNSVQDILELESYGAGAIVLKSLFEQEITAGFQSQVSREAYESSDPMEFDYNYYALKDERLSAYLRLIEETKKKVKIPVIASLHCVSDFEWPDFAQKIEDAGADAIELNVSLSPLNLSLTAQEYEQSYIDLAKQLRSRIKLPLAIKICPYFSNLGPFIKRLSDTGLDGIVMFNRFWNPDFDVENFKVISSNRLSKSEEYSLALRWVALMAGRTTSDLAASTGIHNGETLIKFLLAGASTVQVVSALYKSGKSYLKEYINELEFWMDRHQFLSIDDFRGKMCQAKSKEPDVFERVQFMHYAVPQE